MFCAFLPHGFVILGLKLSEAMTLGAGRLCSDRGVAPSTEASRAKPSGIPREGSRSLGSFQVMRCSQAGGRAPAPALPLLLSLC